MNIGKIGAVLGVAVMLTSCVSQKKFDALNENYNIEIARFVLLNLPNAIAAQPMFCRKIQDGFPIVPKYAFPVASKPIVALFVLVDIP